MQVARTLGALALLQSPPLAQDSDAGLCSLILAVLATSRSGQITRDAVGLEVQADCGLSLPSQVVELGLNQLIRKRLLHKEGRLYGPTGQALFELPPIRQCVDVFNAESAQADSIITALAASTPRGAAWSREQTEVTLVNWLGNFNLHGCISRHAAPVLPQMDAVATPEALQWIAQAVSCESDPTRRAACQRWVQGAIWCRSLPPQFPVEPARVAEGTIILLSQDLAAAWAEDNPKRPGLHRMMAQLRQVCQQNQLVLAVPEQWAPSKRERHAGASGEPVLQIFRSPGPRNRAFQANLDRIKKELITLTAGALREPLASLYEMVAAERSAGNLILGLVEDPVVVARAEVLAQVDPLGIQNGLCSLVHPFTLAALLWAHGLSAPSLAAEFALGLPAGQGPRPRESPWLPQRESELTEAATQVMISHVPESTSTIPTSLFAPRVEEEWTPSYSAAGSDYYSEAPERKSSEATCPVCGGDAFEWGALEGVTNIVVGDRAPQAIRARCCQGCGHLQLFVL